MKKLKVGVLGATGTVGRRFVSLLAGHPWFELSLLAASPRSEGKTYAEAVSGKQPMDFELPESVRGMTVHSVENAGFIADNVDFVFCALNMDKASVKELEERYARLECPVISNNSAHRLTDDVPMIIPELNPEHADIIHAQRRRLNTNRGFIAVKSNCSIQSYVPMLYPLHKLYGLKSAVVSTYQAVSGAGRTLASFPEINDNVIPYIGGEEEKSELEPLKVFGRIDGDRIVPDTRPKISAHCFRVPVSDGHTASVFASFNMKPELDEIRETWESFSALDVMLPSAPERFIHYIDGLDRPQPKLDRDAGGGMTVSVGRLERDSQFDISFVGLSHNTLRGAAGGAVLLAELLTHYGFIDAK